MKKGEKMSEEQKLKTYTLERAMKISATHKARGIHPNPLFSIKSQFKKGVKVSPEIIAKRSLSVTGQKRPRQSLLMQGNKCNFWKGGITKLNFKIRHSYKYKQWRREVFERDDFTCQECGAHGVYLEADHLKPFALILKENKVDSLLIASECKELWGINNGRTLCKECHKKTDSYLNRYSIFYV